MVLVNTLVKQSLQEDMSNDAQHVYFLQKKKAEILARKNREKAGFEPSALLKYANDGSFLERFNKMMMQQQEGQQKQQQKQNLLKQNIFKPLSSTSLSVDTVKLLSVKEPEPVYTSTPTLAREGYVDSHRGDAYPASKSILDEAFENKKRKRKDFPPAFHEGGDINGNGNSHRFPPGKIQRFSADELAKIIQVKKKSEDLPRHLDGSKGGAKNNEVEYKVEKSRGVYSSSQSKTESRKEERSSRRSSSTCSSRESDFKKDKTKQYKHSIYTVKSRKESVKEKLKTDTNVKKEKIPEKVSTEIVATKKQKDRRKTEKKQDIYGKVDKTKQNKEAVIPVLTSNDLSLEMTENVSLPGTTIEKSVHIDESNHMENGIESPPTSVCNGISERISYNVTEKRFNNLTEKTSHKLVVRANSIGIPEMERDSCTSVVVSSNCSDNTHVERNAATIPASVSEPVSDIIDETVKEEDGLYTNPLSPEPDTDIEPVYFVVENSECCELALLELIPQYNFPGRICKNGSPLPIVEFADENDIIYSKYAGSYRSKKITGHVKPVKDNG